MYLAVIHLDQVTMLYIIMKRHNTFVNKNIYSLLYCHEIVERAALERDRETKRWTEDCYHWHHVETHIQSLTSSWFFDRSSSARGLPASPPPADLFTYRLLSELDWISMTPLSLYDILKAHTFSHWFPIQVIYFHCLLFTQVQYSVYKIHNNRLSKINI